MARTHLADARSMAKNWLDTTTAKMDRKIPEVVVRDDDGGNERERTESRGGIGQDSMQNEDGR